MRASGSPGARSSASCSRIANTRRHPGTTKTNDADIEPPVDIRRDRLRDLSWRSRWRTRARQGGAACCTARSRIVAEAVRSNTGVSAATTSVRARTSGAPHLRDELGLEIVARVVPELRDVPCDRVGVRPEVGDHLAHGGRLLTRIGRTELLPGVRRSGATRTRVAESGDGGVPSRSADVGPRIRAARRSAACESSRQSSNVFDMETLCRNRLPALKVGGDPRTLFRRTGLCATVTPWELPPTCRPIPLSRTTFRAPGLPPSLELQPQSAL